MSRLIFFVVEANGNECSTSTQAKKTTNVSELKTIVRPPRSLSCRCSCVGSLDSGENITACRLRIAGEWAQYPFPYETRFAGQTGHPGGCRQRMVSGRVELTWPASPRAAALKALCRVSRLRPLRFKDSGSHQGSTR